MNSELSHGFNFRSKAHELLRAATNINILDVLGGQSDSDTTEQTGIPIVATKPAESAASKTSDLQIAKDDKIERYLGEAKKSWETIDKDKDGDLSHAEVKLAKSAAKDVNTRDFLNYVDINFDSIRTLNATTGSANKTISTKALDRLADLHRQSQLDRKYFKSAQELVVRNFESIDTNSNGQVDSFEIAKFRTNSRLSTDETAQLKYLEMRLRNNYSRTDVQGQDASALPFGNQFSERRASNYYDSYAISKSDLATTTLAQRIEATQRGIYGQLETEFPVNVGKAIGAALGATSAILLSPKGSFNPYYVMGGSATGFAAGYLIGKEVGHYMGRNFYDAHQRGKMKQLQI